MSANNVRIIIMDGFGARLANILDAVKMTPRQAAMRSGVDYPFLIRLINNPEKIPTPETLAKLEKVPELKDFIAREKIDQMVRNYGADSIVEATIQFLKKHPERVPGIRKEIADLIDWQNKE